MVVKGSAKICFCSFVVLVDTDAQEFRAAQTSFKAN